MEKSVALLELEKSLTVAAASTTDTLRFTEIGDLEKILDADAEDLEDVVSTLREIEGLNDLFSQYYELVNCAGNFPSIEKIAAVLVKRIHIGWSASDVAASLLEIAEKKRCTYTRVVRIDGVDLEETIDVLDNCFLVSPFNLPFSEELLSAFSDRELKIILPGSAAIVFQKHSFDPFVPPKNSFSAPARPQVVEEFEKAVECAVNTIVLGSLGSPRRGAEFEYIEDPGWPAVTPVGLAKTPWNWIQGVKLWPKDQDKLSAIAKAISDKLAPHLRMAIEKLRSSRLRSELAERVLDLGTCMEILLMHDLDHSQRGEISYKIRLRAAWLMGKNVEDREKIFALVNKIYALRSQAAHAGYIEAEKYRGGIQALRTDLEYVDSLCVEIIRKIAEEGNPKWNKIVLG